MNDFYVYIYLDPRKNGMFNYPQIDKLFEFEPFYIGKGRGNRINMGIKESKKDYYKNRKIRSMIKDGYFPIALKIFKNLTEKESLEKEIYLIKVIGRMDLSLGPLCNLTDGGEGTTNITPEWKKILSKPVIQLKDGIVISEYISVKSASEITGIIKQNISSALTGRYKTAGGFEWKYKNDSDKLQGHLKNNFKMPNHTEKTRMKMSLSAKRGEDHHMKKKIGKDNPRSRKIIQKELDGKIIKIWDSLQDIKRDLGFSPSNICRCCKGEVKRIGGFLWDYYN
jgi:hypothetical protein